MVAKRLWVMGVAGMLAALALGWSAPPAEAQYYYYPPGAIYAAPAPVYTTSVYYAAPAPLLVSTPVYGYYPSYYPGYCYRPGGFGFSFGYWGGHGGHRYYGHGGRGFGFSFGWRH